MATNALQKITTRAKAIRRAHPGMSWKAAVKKASAEYRGAPKKKASRKKAAVSGTGKKKKAVKVKARRSRKGVTSSISGVSMDKLRSEMLHLHNLEKIKRSQQTMLSEAKTKGDKALLRREIQRTGKAIANCKKHITALKRTI